MNQFGVHYSRREYREEYLSSPEWKEKSQKVLARDTTCRICEVSKSTDAHHLTYQNLPFENLDKDIVGVCRSCHTKIHSWRKLAECKSVSKIRRMISRLNDKVEIKENLVLKMNALNINAKKVLSSMFKKNMYSFESLLGTKISFRQMIELHEFVDRMENRPIKTWRRRSGKRKGFYGANGVLAI